MDIQQLVNRSKKFSLDIIKLFQRLPKTDEARIIGRQLLRSATSVGVNYRAVCRARSDKEFFAKISIVVEEADESLFWLEILEESKIMPPDKLDYLKDEALQLVKIFSSSRKTAGSRLNK
jgi:four helix bundle protein